MSIPRMCPAVSRCDSSAFLSTVVHGCWFRMSLEMREEKVLKPKTPRALPALCESEEDNRKAIADRHVEDPKPL